MLTCHAQYRNFSQTPPAVKKDSLTLNLNQTSSRTANKYILSGKFKRLHQRPNFVHKSKPVSGQCSLSAPLENMIRSIFPFFTPRKYQNNRSFFMF